LAMTTAMITSLLFLLGYVLYHITTPETPYGGQGAIRYVATHRAPSPTGAPGLSAVAVRGSDRARTLFHDSAVLFVSTFAPPCVTKVICPKAHLC